MIGQLPRYTLATPAFRFRSLTALSGRASLGGDRETLVACLQLGRLCAGILPPYEMTRELLLERTENTKQWLSSLAIPSGVRSTAFGIFGALNGFDRARCAIAFVDLVKAASAQLDETARMELNALVAELSASPTAGHVRHTVTQLPPS
ncbi:MAG TPA: hypothetical protein VD771_08155 [Gemmatimonadaceae bacterium]|nr:hypothetical protein [Gemmatimonadaceae bacterium]